MDDVQHAKRQSTAQDDSDIQVTVVVDVVMVLTHLAALEDTNR